MTVAKRPPLDPFEFTLHTYDILEEPGKRLEWLTIPATTGRNAPNCGATSTSFTCSVDAGGNSLPLWAEITLISLASVIILAGIARLFVLYRR